MPMVRIPGTDKVIFVPKMNTDIVYDMNDVKDSDTSITQEDIVVVGNYEDYSTNGSTVQVNNVYQQGLQNENWSDLNASIEGVKGTQFTERGKHLHTHRQRNKLQYVDLTENDNS